MKRSAISTLVLMAIVIIAGILYIVSIDESEVQKRNNTPAAQALLIDEEGKQFTDLEGTPAPVDEYFGNIVVATSWASWCPQCLEGLKGLGEVANGYDREEVSFLAINRAEDRYTAERYLSTVEVPDSLTMILDSSDHYFASSNGYAMPETIVFTREGEIALHQRGNINSEEIKATIDRLLGE